MLFNRFAVLCVLIILCFTIDSSAAIENDVLKDIETNLGNYSFEQVYNYIKSGDLKLSPDAVFSYILNLLFGEIKEVFKLLIYIIVAACINSFITALDASFMSKEVNTAVFSAFYAVFIVIIARVYSEAGEVCLKLLQNVCAILSACVPVCISLIVSTANITKGLALRPLYLYFLEIIAKFSKNFVLPMINSLFAISIIGCISNRFSVKNLTDFLRKIIKWGMTLVLSVFIGSVSIVGVITDKVVIKGAKAVKFIFGNFVPVVGRLLSDTVDTVSSAAIIIKNTAGISGIIIIILICLPPILKLFAMSISFRMCAALIEPISDPRLSKILSILSSSVELMLGICISVSVVFAVSISILISIGG